MFNEAKTTQAAARLIREAGGTLNYMVLIKMLYLADRESLLRRGRPITWDAFKSMRYGPVLSRVHDLITEQSDPSDHEFWKSFVSDPCDWSVKLLDDPGEGKLSASEKGFLDWAFAECASFVNRPFDLAKKFHKEFPEVIEIEKGKQAPLYFRDILEKNHVPENEMNAILSEIDSLKEMESALTVAAFEF